MKKALILCMVLALAIALGIGSAYAGAVPDDGKKIWQFNLIGYPGDTFSKGYSGKADTSNGRAIMIPLKTAMGSRVLECPKDGFSFYNDEAPRFMTSVPEGGVKLIWEKSSDVTDFTIADRDAVDGSAKILVPTSLLDAQGYIKFDVWIRVLGKPNSCMGIDAYAYDQQQNLYFWAGTVELSRRTGKSVFQKVDDLFNVHFCQVVEGACDPATIAEYSVFDNLFE